MKIATGLILTMITLPVILFIIEYFLAKNKNRAAMILPMIVACFFAIAGFYALIIGAIMFAINLIMQHIDKEKQAKLSEIEKMNIEDL
ncbi:MAG: hypothetical protein RR396_01385 [Clostridiales bacterium]